MQYFVEKTEVYSFWLQFIVITPKTGRHFVETYNLLDEVVRGNAFMNLETLKELMNQENIQLTDHDCFLIELYCSNYNPRKLHTSLQNHCLVILSLY